MKYLRHRLVSVSIGTRSPKISLIFVVAAANNKSTELAPAPQNFASSQQSSAAVNAHAAQASVQSGQANSAIVGGLALSGTNSATVGGLALSGTSSATVGGLAVSGTSDRAKPREISWDQVPWQEQVEELAQQEQQRLRGALAQQKGQQQPAAMPPATLQQQPAAALPVIPQQQPAAVPQPVQPRPDPSQERQTSNQWNSHHAQQQGQFTPQVLQPQAGGVLPAAQPPSSSSAHTQSSWQVRPSQPAPAGNAASHSNQDTLNSSLRSQAPAQNVTPMDTNSVAAVVANSTAAQLTPAQPNASAQSLPTAGNSAATPSANIAMTNVAAATTATPPARAVHSESRAPRAATPRAAASPEGRPAREDSPGRAYARDVAVLELWLLKHIHVSARFSHRRLHFIQDRERASAGHAGHKVLATSSISQRFVGLRHGCSTSGNCVSECRRKEMCIRTACLFPCSIP